MSDLIKPLDLKGFHKQLLDWSVPSLSGFYIEVSTVRNPKDLEDDSFYANRDHLGWWYGWGNKEYFGRWFGHLDLKDIGYGLDESVTFELRNVMPSYGDGVDMVFWSSDSTYRCLFAQVPNVLSSDNNRHYSLQIGMTNEKDISKEEDMLLTHHLSITPLKVMS